MALVVMRSQFPQFLHWMDLSTRGLYLRLFVNAHTPTETDNIDMYEEPYGSWYEPVRLDNWNTPALGADNKGRVSHPLVTFTFDGEETTLIHGYFVTDEEGNYVYWAERDPDGPIYLSSEGQTYKVVPKLTDRNDPSP